MKKFILVVFIGMVLAINVYGIVNHFMKDAIKNVDHIAETTSIVYME